MPRGRNILISADAGSEEPGHTGLAKFPPVYHQEIVLPFSQLDFSMSDYFLINPSIKNRRYRVFGSSFLRKAPMRPDNAGRCHLYRKKKKTQKTTAKKIKLAGHGGTHQWSQLPGRLR